MIIQGATAVVTGAAGGIGREVARALARRGSRLALCDVDAPALERLCNELRQAGHDVFAEPTDIADREQIRHFAESVSERMGGADILVNCAGVYMCGTARDISLDDWDWVISVNLLGVIHTCHFFLPQLALAGKRAHICNIVSMYGFWPSGGVTGYLASKFGVFGYSHALAEDLRGTGVGVSTVCPGMINTGIIETMRIRGAGAGAECVRSTLRQKYASRGYGPQRVAAAVTNGIEKDKRLVLVSPEARFIYYLERFWPWFSRRIARSATRRLFRAS